ncbi:putative metallophosphoesterase YhaO [Roseimaritima multifibrata]|uniref:Putative metallophosphoesterase YhaO n=1 Tax=Roseimaritima multifibrata TaxID=1930274 RepID=A0A517MBH4_9BACT|nr:DNA repair exonuclease [Roseimaritima multifibrata]QDS92223.1 putative metallophosphoesterase YhaO [Roseimaritima multifibrata]
MKKFIHAADLHLDSPLQRLEQYEGAPVEQIRGASRRALENLVALALKEEVDLVVIAGDLYDGDWQEFNTGLFFVTQVSRLIKAGIPVVAISGNHDAASQMTKSLPLPKNPDGSEIMLSSRQAESRRFLDLGIVVHGRSFGKRSETENMIPGYPPADAGMFNIGLLHTSLTGAEGHDNYAPCTPAQLADKEYDYWALGHVHTRSEQHDVTDPAAAPILFSGNIQGRHPRETGAKGCVVVEIDEQGKPTTKFEALDVVRWEVCELDAAECETEDELYDLYADWLQAAMEQAEHRILVHRIRVTGASALHEILNSNRIDFENNLRAHAISVANEQTWIEQVRIKTRPKLESELDFDPAGPLGCLEAVLSEMEQLTDLELFEEALQTLQRKLPAELTAANVEPLDLLAPESLQEWVAAARPLLHHHLKQQEDS